MNAAHQTTVHWLQELTPTLESRAVALETYREQTGWHEGDPDPELIATNGVWGFVGPDAVLLFAVPHGG